MPPDKARAAREAITKQALADAVRSRMTGRHRYQTDLARRSGVSRSCVRYVLRGEKTVSFFTFLELSSGLGVEDASDFLQDVLKRRNTLCANHAPTA